MRKYQRPRASIKEYFRVSVSAMALMAHLAAPVVYRRAGRGSLHPPVHFPSQLAARLVTS